MNYILRKENLLKMVRTPKENPFPGVIGTYMGRDALSLAVSSLDLGPDDTVLLPAYLCREVLRPFLGKPRVEYYDIRPDLTVNPEDIELKLVQNSVKLMVIINYFGFLQPYRKELKDLCADRGVVLIEDCAHSPLTEGSGDTGDIAIYSFRKILPLPDGGGLKMNNKGKAVTAKFYSRIYSNILSILILAKLLLNVRNEIFSRAGITDKKKDIFPDAQLSKENSRILPLSSFAYNGMGNMAFPGIIEKRRNNYQFWQEFVGKTNRFTPVFCELPSGVCPMGFPGRTKDRDRLISLAQQQGIHLQVHWNLPDGVGKEFVNSHELSQQTITLPIYPELGQREREGIQRLLGS